MIPRKLDPRCIQSEKWPVSNHQQIPLSVDPLLSRGRRGITVLFGEILCDHPGRGEAALKRAFVCDCLDNVSGSHLQSQVISNVFVSLSTVLI